MPTGYTCKIQTGELTDRSEFLWNVAHMFGGFTCTGDDFNINSDVEKHVTISTYEEDRIEKLLEDLEYYKSVSDDVLQSKIGEVYNRNLEDNDRIRKQYSESRKRYEAMLEKVNVWTPPTREHENIKKEAIRQLEDSIKWDCCEAYITEPIRYGVKEYRQTMIEATSENLARAYDNYNKMFKAHNSRIKWLKDLQESLK